MRMPDHLLCLCSYLLVIKDVRTGSIRHLLARHVIVCHGIMGRPKTPEVWYTLAP